MKYTKAMIEAIELEVEDVVLTSGGDCPTHTSCDAEAPVCTTECDGNSCRTMIW